MDASTSQAQTELRLLAAGHLGIPRTQKGLEVLAEAISAIRVINLLRRTP
ncbi:DUF1704 domain-containing protein [Thiorhodococcus minor]|uniref:DUF1704 domain-containing protein n=1 Tax=Thiorhodococcus minor TaxID=57489 RepID=A0A6M0JXG6_9GAMM|nr:DUF1704 domain-containing protein [Thiorhodococcus minor]NEV61323.1 DUF1704 domain-containing protein [Thiorhodococcus minor]